MCATKCTNILIDIKCSDRNHGFRKGFSCETQLTITVDELCRNLDKGLQTDVAILDFSKAFDKVPHDLLLYKLDCYGIRGNLHAWIKAFLTNRQMRVIVENEASAETTVHSGVPQGTVLGPLLFLVHINDLPDRVRSSIVRLFADDCLLYRTISSLRDHVLLQEDLRQLEAWASDWGMHFNASKCYILSINNKSSYYYQLNNTILQNIDNNPYLGLLISKDLKIGEPHRKSQQKSQLYVGFYSAKPPSLPVSLPQVSIYCSGAIHPRIRLCGVGPPLTAGCGQAGESPTQSSTLH